MLKDDPLSETRQTPLRRGRRLRVLVNPEKTPARRGRLKNRLRMSAKTDRRVNIKAVRLRLKTYQRLYKQNRLVMSVRHAHFLN